MADVFPDHASLRAALAMATRAPSVHNSQPWRWRVGIESVQLWVDPEHHLPNIDPDRRDLLVSCGAALNHFVVALAALGWQAKVHRFPNPARPLHLATVETTAHRPSEADVSLAAAIPRRRTDRRLFSSWPVPYGDIALMGARTARAGVRLLRVEDLDELKDAVNQAAYRHATDDAYVRELTAWSGRHGSLAGVPARNTPVPEQQAAVPGRVFAGAALAQPPGATAAGDNAVVLALGTRDDDQLARLRAGEATSIVLLTATALGLSSSPITEPLEVAETRKALREQIFEDGEYPQMLLRIGWAPINADPLPATPRWPLSHVVSMLDGSPFNEFS